MEVEETISPDKVLVFVGEELAHHTKGQFRASVHRVRYVIFTTHLVGRAQ
jgi:isopenicillin N synthase-like dioxygenase